MAPRFRSLRGPEVIRAFERAGGLRRSGKGDHVNIKMPNGRIVTVRSRGYVGIGLLKDLLKRAGLMDEEFERLLR